MTTKHIHPEREPGNPVVHWAARVRKDLESRGEHRKSLNVLRRLDDRMLKDIGIHRSEINAVVYGSASGLSR